MKTIILIIAVILFSCSEEEVKPSFSCDEMRQVRDKAFEAWQITYDQKKELPTLKEAGEWYERSQAAMMAYREAEKLLADNCYDHKTKKDL